MYFLSCCGYYTSFIYLSKCQWLSKEKSTSHVKADELKLRWQTKNEWFGVVFGFILNYLHLIFSTL